MSTLVDHAARHTMQLILTAVMDDLMIDDEEINFLIKQARSHFDLNETEMEELHVEVNRLDALLRKYYE